MHLLIQRVLRRHLFQARDDLRVFSGIEPRLEQRPPYLVSQQIKPTRLLLQPDRTGQVRQRPAPPQSQRLPQLPRALGRVGGLPAPPQQPLGGPCIGAVIAKIQQVAGRRGR